MKKKVEVQMKSEKGVTMITLVLTIALLTIFATIGVDYGIEIMRKAENENIKTNMLLIKAKAKEYQEEVDFKSGIEEDNEDKAEEARVEVYEETVGLESVGELSEKLIGIGVEAGNENYYVTEDAFTTMGLQQIEVRENEKYIISYNEEEKTIEIFSTLGTRVEEYIDGEKVIEIKYSLTELGE